MKTYGSYFPESGKEFRLERERRKGGKGEGGKKIARRAGRDRRQLLCHMLLKASLIREGGRKEKGKGLTFFFGGGGGEGST